MDEALPGAHARFGPEFMNKVKFTSGFEKLSSSVQSQDTPSAKHVRPCVPRTKQEDIFALENRVILINPLRCLVDQCSDSDQRNEAFCLAAVLTSRIRHAQG